MLKLNIPSSHLGFALNPYESEYPSLHEGLGFAVVPAVQGNGFPALDYSKNAYMATTIGAPSYSAGVLSQALRFNGSSDGLSFGTPLVSDSGPYPGSMVCWVRPNVTNQGGTIWGISNSATTGDNNVIELRFTGAARIQMRTETSVAQSIGFYSAGVWYCVGCTFVSQSDRSLWLDGVFQASNATSQNKTGLNITTIGYRSRPTPDTYFNGDIAGVLFYNRILSGDEMRLFYNVPFAPFVQSRRIYGFSVPAGGAAFPPNSLALTGVGI